MPEQPTEIHKRVGDLEKGHGKLKDIKAELRLISMEYADIRSRIEATDTILDSLTHQLDTERRMRRISLLLILTVLVMTAILLTSMTF